MVVITLCSAYSSFKISKHIFFLSFHSCIWGYFVWGFSTVSFQLHHSDSSVRFHFESMVTEWFSYVCETGLHERSIEHCVFKCVVPIHNSSIWLY